MPIYGSSLGDAARTFRNHLNQLLARTVTQVPVVIFNPPGSSRAYVGFRQAGAPVPAPLTTRFGPLDLSVLQICGTSIEEDGRHRLRTEEYVYTLTRRGEAEPCIRWEFVRERPDPDSRWARHHIQGPFSVGLTNEGVSANELHTPTGFVTIEEVLRFCIVDLSVAPLSAEWNEHLDASYLMFKSDFALPDLTDPTDPAF